MSEATESILPARASGASPEPACGKCGYCVRGIEGLTCPECGSDLREVGILTGPHRRPVAPWAYAALWTLALPVGALLISLLLMRTVLPFSRTTKVQRVMFFSAPPYLFTTVNVSGASREWQPALANRTPAPPQVLQLHDLPSGRSMQVDMKTGAYSYRKKNGTTVQRSSGMNGGVLADWLGTCGFNAADPRVRSLCNIAYPALAEVSQGGAAAAGFTPFKDATGRQLGIAHPAFTWPVYDEPHPAVIASLAVFWLLVWVYGIRRISRRTCHATAVAP